MPDYHRGRARDRYYDDDYDNDDTYYTEPERRPAPTKHRSMSRRAKDKLEDKLEDAMEKLGLAESGSNNSNALTIITAVATMTATVDTEVKATLIAMPTAIKAAVAANAITIMARVMVITTDITTTTTTTSTAQEEDTAPRPLAITIAIASAVDAAALEAFRLRKEPGGWTSAKKTTRIATAAISAAAIGSAMDDKHPGKEKKGELGTIGSAIGGLLVNRVVNGSRKDNRRYD
ncbi:hypothetical protein QBC37DRAFT_380295 [Rhypophila decipiens]|uniref:Uncharacterized protein n=1 Tax=Rhypophila decipiens TaxID=261697 RepID=A0AAN7B1X5_9PEZI|nr:hypothetical protein QBC37DRAFT_380295 [Rhypophila decipiens]